MRIEERHYAETARDYARRMLKANIISMELVPGAMVSENELAAQMGLSRTPVREALMDLAQYHVVDVLPQRGSRISLIDYALVEESRFVRQVLETAILDQVCERATPADISQLRQNVRLQALTQEPEMSGSLSMMELDDAFHQILFLIAQKENTFRMLLASAVINNQRRAGINQDTVTVVCRLVSVALIGHENYCHNKSFYPDLLNSNSTEACFLFYPPKFTNFSQRY